jgi:hypothetical protein
MFSRRDVLAASAMGAAMTVSAAKAGSFGNPDQPAEGASGTSRLRNENAPGTGVEAPRAQQLGIKRQFNGAAPRSYLHVSHASDAQANLNHTHGVTNDVHLA